MREPSPPAIARMQLLQSRSGNNLATKAFIFSQPTWTARALGSVAVELGLRTHYDLSSFRCGLVTIEQRI